MISDLLCMVQRELRYGWRTAMLLIDYIRNMGVAKPNATVRDVQALYA